MRLDGPYRLPSGGPSNLHRTGRCVRVWCLSAVEFKKRKNRAFSQLETMILVFGSLFSKEILISDD